MMGQLKKSLTNKKIFIVKKKHYERFYQKKNF